MTPPSTPLFSAGGNLRLAEDRVLATVGEVTAFVLAVDIEVEFVLAAEFQLPRSRVPKDGTLLTSRTTAPFAYYIPMPFLLMACRGVRVWS
jgi:hypothetical protein